MAGRRINGADVEVVLRRAVGGAARLLHFQLQPFDATTVGFMGEHLTLLVRYAYDQQDEQPQKGAPKELTFFLKQLPESERYRSFVLTQGFFAKEREMYEKLLPLMAGALGSELPVPQCYLVVDDSFVVFEDLRRAGFRMHDRFELLDLRLIRAAIAAVAKLHAGSFAVELKTGKLMPFHAKHSYEALIVDERSDNYISRQWHFSSLKTAFGLLQKMDQFRSRLSGANWDNVYETLRLSWERSAEATGGNSARFRNCLSHGDLWLNNVLFREGNNGEVDAVLVDFQAYRYAPPVVDLLMLMHFTTTRHFRLQHQEQLLEFYFERLVENLEVAGVVREEIPISLSELHESAKEFKTFAIVIAARYLQTCLKQGLVVQQPTNTQEAEEENGGPQTNFIRDNSGVLTDIFKNQGLKGKLFEGRMTECLEEILDELNL